MAWFTYVGDKNVCLTMEINIRNLSVYNLCKWPELCSFNSELSYGTIFYGTIQIAYIQNGRVFGISKLVRVVEKFSKRLQIQERITKNVADEIYAQGVKGVAVMAEGEHLCMKMRGVRNDAQMTSSAFRGVFEDQKTKEELLKAIQNK